MDFLEENFPQPRLAKKRTRIVAAILDGIILMGAIFVVVAILMGEKDSFYTSTANGISIGFNLQGTPALVALGIWFVLLPLMEGFGGQTIGKKIVGVKVVTKDYGPISPRHSIIRHLLDCVDLFCFIGLIIAATNPKKQRIGDLAAQTLVVVKD